MTARFFSLSFIMNSGGVVSSRPKSDRNRSGRALDFAAITLITVMSVAATSTAYAQENPTVEQLQKQLEEQRIALEEAIANRESTAAKAEEIRQELAESDEQQRAVEEELTELCEEQEELKAGTLAECLKNLDS